MKTMKKLLAFIVALTMIMGMATTAFAKTPDLSGHEYVAYQIFAGTQTAAPDTSVALGDITWGTGIKGADFLQALKADATIGSTFTNATTAKDVAEAIKEWSDDSTNARKFAAIAYKNKSTTSRKLEDNTVLDAGYYLIVDTTNFAEDATDTATNLALLQLTKKGPLDIAVKVDIPEVKKEIVEGSNKVTNNEAAIGEDVNYEITGTLPSKLADYETYYYWFKDTLSKGLTYNNDVKVYVKNGEDETEVTSYFYKNSNEDGDNTIIDVAIQDVKSLNLIDGITVNAQTKIIVKYSAKVNQDVVIAGSGNDNKVTLEYSNNPDNSGTPTTTPPDGDHPKPEKKVPTGKTPESKVVTYVTELTIIKTDENGQKLEGAEFTLTGTNIHSIKVTTGQSYEVATNGTYYKLKNGTYTTTAPQAEVRDDDNNVTIESNEDLYESTTVKYALTDFVETTGEATDDKSVAAFVDAYGKIKFTGLGAGNYTIKETVVPAGYNKAEDITFTISYDNGTFTAISPKDTETTKVVVVGEKENTFQTTIINRSGAVLPETGGMGTRLFYIFGAVMVLFAGVLLVAKRRMNRA